MANRCEICGKHSGSGHNVSHAKNRTKRRWRPNLQKTTVGVGEEARQIKVCTRCLRTQRKSVA